MMVSGFTRSAQVDDDLSGYRAVEEVKQHSVDRLGAIGGRQVAEARKNDTFRAGQCMRHGWSRSAVELAGRHQRRTIDGAQSAGDLRIGTGEDAVSA